MSRHFDYEKLKTVITLPEWTVKELNNQPEFFRTDEEKMALAIRLSRLNFENETGGPFAACIFEKESGRLLVAGVNRVVPLNCSTAHAEIVAISMAQQLQGTFDLGGPGMPHYELVVNWRPCAMCYGAMFWSGIRSLMIAGSGDELEKITGFDEGPIHPDWIEECAKRSVSVKENILKEEALKVFHDYAESGQPVYNGRAED